jgi:Predicted RNA polymerase sigma factor containing a TPR repeat domain
MLESELTLQIEQVYAEESRRVLATLIRLLGDFDRAEEALHDAFRAALEQWPRDGIPANPRAWLVSTGRFKAIDSLRRRARFDASLAEIAHQIDLNTPEEFEIDDEDQVQDDRLRLIFTCCHPLLAPEARVALTLREVCGLTTEAIAHAFLLQPTTLAQRIVRAKAKIRDAKLPYQVPSRAELPERLDTVLQVIYLVFNEGYSSSSGESLTRPDLSNEAIRLATLLYQLLPEAEVQGLLALMLLHEARRPARSDQNGDLIPLEEQDRSLWKRDLIATGTQHAQEAWQKEGIGPYCIQAAIAALHCEATSVATTDWPQIVALYELLLRLRPSPVIELNRAIAIAMRDGPEHGLVLVDQLIESGQLNNYHLLYATRADLCRRLEQRDQARQAYQQALALTNQEPERRFLQKRLLTLG